MEKYRVTYSDMVVLRTDSFKEACEKFIELLERSIDEEWLESVYRDVYIEKLKKGSHIYLPIKVQLRECL